jgi:hypothetical protein
VRSSVRAFVWGFAGVLLAVVFSLGAFAIAEPHLDPSGRGLVPLEQRRLDLAPTTTTEGTGRSPTTMAVMAPTTTGPTTTAAARPAMTGPMTTARKSTTTTDA